MACHWLLIEAHESPFVYVLRVRAFSYLVQKFFSTFSLLLVILVFDYKNFQQVILSFKGEIAFLHKCDCLG